MLLKRIARDSWARFVRGVGLSGPGRFREGDLLVLTFHRVLPTELLNLYPLRGLVVTPEELRWVLSETVPHFEVAPVSVAFQRWRNRRDTRPLLCVSFDDGQWDNVAYAAPVLAEFAVSATFYVPTDHIGSKHLLWHDRAAFGWHAAAADRRGRDEVLRASSCPPASDSIVSFMAALKRLTPGERRGCIDRLWHEQAGCVSPQWARLMDWADVRRLHADGHEIGSHAASHELLPQLTPQEQLRELQESRARIGRETGVVPLSVCYPNGSYDAVTLGAAATAGYECGLTTRWGRNRRGQPPLELLRCDVDASRLLDRHGRLSAARLWMRLCGLQPGL